MISEPTKVQRLIEERNMILANRKDGEEPSEDEGEKSPMQLNENQAIQERFFTSKKNIKVLKHTLKSLVEPADCKYIIVTPNSNM